MAFPWKPLKLFPKTLAFLLKPCILVSSQAKHQNRKAAMKTTLKAIMSDLNKVCSFNSVGVKIEKAGLFSINTFNEDFSASIELTHTMLNITVSNRHDGETIGIKSHRLTSFKYHNIKSFLMDTYWPNK